MTKQEMLAVAKAAVAKTREARTQFEAAQVELEATKKAIGLPDLEFELEQSRIDLFNAEAALGKAAQLRRKDETNRRRQGHVDAYNVAKDRVFVAETAVKEAEGSLKSLKNRLWNSRSKLNQAYSIQKKAWDELNQAYPKNGNGQATRNGKTDVAKTNGAKARYEANRRNRAEENRRQAKANGNGQKRK